MGPKPEPTIPSSLVRRSRSKQAVGQGPEFSGESRCGASAADDESEGDDHSDPDLEESDRGNADKELSDLEKSQAGDTEAASDVGSWADELDEAFTTRPHAEAASETGSWAPEPVVPRLQTADELNDGQGTECASNVGSWVDDVSGSPRVEVSVAPSGGVDAAGNPVVGDHAKTSDFEKSNIDGTDPAKKRRKSLRARSTGSHSEAVVSEMNSRTEKTASIFNMKAVSSAGGSAPPPPLSRSRERCAEAITREKEARRGLLEALRRPKIVDCLLAKFIDPSVQLTFEERERFTRLLALLTSGIEEDLLGCAIKKTESAIGDADPHSPDLGPAPLPEISLQAITQELQCVYEVVHHPQHLWLRRVEALSRLQTSLISSLAGLRWLSRSLFSSQLKRSEVLPLIAQAPVFVMIRRAVDKHPHQAVLIFGFLQQVLDFAQSRPDDKLEHDEEIEEAENAGEWSKRLEREMQSTPGEIDRTEMRVKVSSLACTMLVYLIKAFNHALPVLDFAYQRAHRWDGAITRQFATELLGSIKPPYSPRFTWALVRWLALPEVIVAVAPTPESRGLVLQFCNDCFSAASECALLQCSSNIEAALCSVREQLGHSPESNQESKGISCLPQVDTKTLEQAIAASKSRSRKTSAKPRNGSIGGSTNQKRPVPSGAAGAESRKLKRLKRKSLTTSSDDENTQLPGKENKKIVRKLKQLSSDEDEFHPGCFEKMQPSRRIETRKKNTNNTPRATSDAELSVSSHEDSANDDEAEESIDGKMEAAMGLTSNSQNGTAALPADNKVSTNQQIVGGLSAVRIKKVNRKQSSHATITGNATVTVPSPDPVPHSTAGGNALRIGRPRTRTGNEGSVKMQ
eukprot:gnl/MRDRNA2_/MRDRNA2_60197_c1_seq1.p1 gnl/MRDRNA2_/MRDRNA2_60197_c1~~gnl/MRDRNA2_/MRDRNA2_60197_c1_seq1.p1  ORF type:complete len:947 (+),score=170.30 gnl/MRDRNA2_/MRDRNA2_60197_c1_seq1:270-2843(+)